MRSRLIILILFIIVIIGAIVVIQSELLIKRGVTPDVNLGPTDTSARAVKGKAAPGFSLLDYDDNVHSLEEYRGKIVVLNFWASWCPCCIDEMPTFQEVFDELKDQNLVVVGINRGESKQVAERYSNDLRVNYPLFLNRADDVARVYQIRAMPTTFFIDQAGVIQDIKLGPMTKEEMKARLFTLFNIGQQIDMPSEQIIGQDAPRVPEEVRQSSRPISITKGVKHSVPLNSIQSGGPPKDGIPSIDKPKFESIKDANKYVDDDGLGLAVSFNEIDRFYPNQILVWHEIVNDNVGGQAALITYCPLCGTGIVFDPIVNGIVTEFGTSGKLWNSNLVMYDRQTDSYWVQSLGESIKGEMTGTKLTLLPHQNLTYKNWKAEHPNGQVLSRETGFVRNYTSSPYGDYDTSRTIIFPVDNTDSRYHEKALTYGIDINDKTKVYVIEELQKGSASFEDSLGGVAFKVEFNKDNETISLHRLDNGQEIVPFFGFWFAWVAIHPDTEVYLGS